MKSLEDTIVSEIERSVPELVNKVPRTTTAKYTKKYKNINSSNNTMTTNRSDYSSSTNFTQSTTANNTSNNSNSNQSRLSLTNQSNDLAIHSNGSPDLVDNFGFVSREINPNKLKPLLKHTNGHNNNGSSEKSSPENELEMIKKLVISDQISSAMNILDNIRKVTKAKKSVGQASKKLQFDSKLAEALKSEKSGLSVLSSGSNSNLMASKNNSMSKNGSTSSKKIYNSLKAAAGTSVTTILPPLKRQSSRSSKLGLGRSPSIMSKLEPNLVKYNEWKSEWYHQLQNI
jgi:hypothetical protein